MAQLSGLKPRPTIPAYRENEISRSLRPAVLSAVFAVEQIAHCPAAGGVYFSLGLALGGVHGALGDGGLLGFRDTTGWAVIGETRLTWP